MATVVIARLLWPSLVVTRLMFSSPMNDGSMVMSTESLLHARILLHRTIGQEGDLDSYYISRSARCSLRPSADLARILVISSCFFVVAE